MPTGATNTAQRMYFQSFWEVCHALIKPVLYSFRKLQLPSNLKLQNCCKQPAEALKIKLYIWIEKEEIEEGTISMGQLGLKNLLKLGWNTVLLS